MTENGCKLCGMGVGTEPGLSQGEIARKYGVARSSVQRHLKGLADGKKPKKAKDSATPQDRTISSLEIKGDVGTAKVSVNQDLDAFFTERGIDPKTVVITARKLSEWETKTAEGIKVLRAQNVAFKLIDLAPRADLDEMYSRIEESRRDRRFVIKPARDTTEDALVVLWADPQTGKVDINGDTKDLRIRLEEKRDLLYNYIHHNPAKSAHFVNLGDSIEGIQNTASQLATNDLAHTEQLEVERDFEHMFIDLLAATHDEVSVSVVPSNHCQLRQGKGLIGKPGDDYGIQIVKNIEFAYGLNPDLYGHVRFQYPENKWLESMVIDAGGTKIAVAHGHQKMQPNAIPDWWKGQIHGARLHEAQVLVTGHFHHYLVRNTGVQIGTNRPKFHIQAPALDNGSAWYQNISGEAALAGLVIFRTNKDGFVPGSLDIL